MFQVGQWKFQFRHVRPDQIDWSNYEGPPFKMLTICTIEDANEEFEDFGVRITGTARCSINDEFCRATGRKVALANALANGPFSKSLRTEIWNAYNSGCRNAQYHTLGRAGQYKISEMLPEAV